MSYITAQQAKLDLELVSMEKRLEIRKCNERLNPGKIQREPTFQVVLNALALTPCYSRNFPALINKSLSGKTTGLDKLRLFREQIHHQKNVDYVELLWENFIYQIDNKAYKSKRRYTTLDSPKDDYLINTLRFVSAKVETQIYGAILLECLTSPEMKETQAYQTYLGATPPKKARKFKKTASPQLTTVPVSLEEPMKKLKRVKRSAKKSCMAPAGGVVIRGSPEIPLSKKKEKVDVVRGKEIELLSEVALTEEAHYEEVRRKSSRDFHKIHPSGFCTVIKTAPSAAKIKPSVINEGTDVKLGEISQVIEDAHVTLSTIPRKNEVLVTSSSHSSNLASKFLNFSNILHTDAEIVSPMDVHIHHEVPSKRTPTLLTVPVPVITESSQIYSNDIPQSIPSFTPPSLQSTPILPPKTKAKNPPSTLPDFASVF
nr:hypothetical protein [Tanacetum cinerariifolium]